MHKPLKDLSYTVKRLNLTAFGKTFIGVWRMQKTLHLVVVLLTISRVFKF